MAVRKNIGGGDYTPSRGAYAGRTFPSRRQYENQVARDRGFENKSQRNVRKKSIALDYPSIESFHGTSEGKASLALRKMKSDGVSLSKAARSVGTTPANVRRYYGDALERKGGTFRANDDDTAVIPMHVATTEGDRIAYVRGSHDRKLVGQHAAVIGRIAQSMHRKYGLKARAIGEAELARFRGRTIVSADGNTYELVSDFDTIRRLLRSGRLHNDSPYDDKAA